MQLLHELLEARRLDGADELGLGLLALLFEPGAIRDHGFRKAQLGSGFAQAAHLDVEIARRAELTGDPLQLVVQTARFGWQQVAEQAQRGAHAAGRHAHLMDV